MKSRIKVFFGFKDAEGDVQKLTHHGTDDSLNCLPQAVLYKVTMAGM